VIVPIGVETHEFAVELTTDMDKLLIASLSLALASFIQTLLIVILSSANGLSFASNCITMLLSLLSNDAYFARSILHEQIVCQNEVRHESHSCAGSRHIIQVAIRSETRPKLKPGIVSATMVRKAHEEEL